MKKEKNIGNFEDELRLSEPNQRGWKTVYSHGKLYEKKTIIHDNGTTRIYNPLPLRKEIKQR